MAAQNKSIKKLNVQNFLTFLNDADTKNAQHVIDIAGGKIYTKITNESKEFIKHVSASLEGIGGDWSDFNDGAYRFYMTDLNKIIKAFNIAKTLKKETVNVKVACAPVDGEGYTRIDRMWIEGQLKLQITAKDASFNFHYIPDSRWTEMLAAPTFAEFDLDNEDIDGLKKIFSYLTIEDNKSGKEQGLHIHFAKDDAGAQAIKFTEDDEKVFTLIHNKNVQYQATVPTNHMSFHAYIIELLNQSLYRVHVKHFGEVQFLVAIPTSDAPRIIVIPLTDQAQIK